MGVMMLIVWLPLLLIVAWVLREFGGRTGGNEPPTHRPADLDAREFARRAYARGEMDREHYLRVMEDLAGTEHR